MELISVEPEVALTISKGDSLIFKISKVDIHKANQIRAALDLLRADWLQLKTRAEVRSEDHFFLFIIIVIKIIHFSFFQRQRLAAMKLETTQLEVQRSIQQLEQWISNAILSPNQDKKVIN